jgi:hypothetical protein
MNPVATGGNIGSATTYITKNRGAVALDTLCYAEGYSTLFAMNVFFL